MDNLDALDQAAAGFAATLAVVTVGQWADPSPNEGWSVRHLVDHVIGGDRMAIAILGGGTREDGLAAFARSADDTDLVTAFAQARRQLAAAFAEPGALDRIVAHPAMPMPGSQLLEFRICEYGLHGWDLAQAIEADSTIAPEVVAKLWELLEPIAPMLPSTGMFGSGASGGVGSEASLQDRVLDVSGRRPLA
jgi:uncharacterized protein (TIGR03086 family)